MYRRNLASSISEALSDTRVVLINGPRQSGKSTLARSLGQELGGTYLSLDDPAVHALASADPAGFIGQAIPEPIVIDEAQRVPEIFLAIKAAVDRDPRPGRFLLTGSANYLMLPRVADSLAGRIEINTLLPLSQGELAGVREGFVEAIFARDDPALSPSSESRHSIFQRALVGGYPEAVARSRPDRAAAWFDSYVATLLQRDIRDIANVEAITAFPALLGLLASRSASLVNMADISRTLGLPYTTLQRYVSLLVAMFLVDPLGAWSSNASTRFVRSPKLPLCDSGLMAHLLGDSRDALAGDAVSAGPLLETFVIAELRKQIACLARRPAIWFLRTHARIEVDILLEHGAGRQLAGIEVKASSSISRKDFRGLEWLREQAGDHFVRGVVLYTGEHTLPFGDRLWAMPMDALWRLGARPQDGGAPAEA